MVEKKKNLNEILDSLSEKKNRETDNSNTEDLNELGLDLDLNIFPTYYLVNTIYAILLIILIIICYMQISQENQEKMLELLNEDSNWRPETSFKEKIIGNLTSERFIKCIFFISISFSIFTLIHFASRSMWRKFYKGYDNLSLSDRIALSEKVNSTIHGLVVGIWSINLVFIENLWKEDIIKIFPNATDWVLCFSIGYEIYDLGAMAVQRSDPLEMWIHHYAMILGYTLCMWYKRMSFCCIILLVTELTVVPSNLHWYMKIFAVKDTRAFHFNQGLRLWSFVFFRIFTVPYIFYRVYHQFDDMFNEDMIIILATLTIPLLLGGLNVYWTWTLQHLYRKRTRLKDKFPKKKRGSLHMSHLKNINSKKDQ
eukprot:TRINITY_DN4722_c0_g1_i1.p1 TRINITY_DN4722_c0_g1~~TRINITY_DN4722_c0_g1_i1.p1  ORF type:complete len:375 (+),score=64.53 TRINITY_DN4722_c0_g1_i1:24-1127(+)